MIDAIDIPKMYAAREVARAVRVEVEAVIRNHGDSPPENLLNARYEASLAAEAWERALDRASMGDIFACCIRHAHQSLAHLYRSHETAGQEVGDLLGGVSNGAGGNMRRWDWRAELMAIGDQA